MVHYPSQPESVVIFMEQAEAGDPDILKAAYVSINHKKTAAVSAVNSQNLVTLSGYQDGQLNQVGLVLNDQFIVWGGGFRIQPDSNLFLFNAKYSIAVVGGGEREFIITPAMAEQKTVQGIRQATAFLFNRAGEEWRSVSTNLPISELSAEYAPDGQGAVIKFEQQSEPFTKIEVNFPK